MGQARHVLLSPCTHVPTCMVRMSVIFASSEKHPFVMLEAGGDLMKVHLVITGHAFASQCNGGNAIGCNTSSLGMCGTMDGWYTDWLTDHCYFFPAAAMAQLQCCSPADSAAAAAQALTHCDVHDMTAQLQTLHLRPSLADAAILTPLQQLLRVCEQQVRLWNDCGKDVDLMPFAASCSAAAWHLNMITAFCCAVAV